MKKIPKTVLWILFYLVIILYFASGYALGGVGLGFGVLHLLSVVNK